MTFCPSRTGKIIENFPEALYIQDLNGNILAANERASRILNYEKEQLEEINIKDITNGKSSESTPDKIINAAQKGNPFDTKLVRKDGIKISVELKASISEIEGEERVLVSIREIDRWEEAEEKFKKFFDNAPEPSVLLDENNLIVYVNKRFTETFGYRLEEIKFENINDVIVPEGLKEEAKKLDKQGSEGYVNYETVRKGKDGEFPVSASANRLRVDNKDYFITIYKNIKERKEAEKASVEQREKLRQLHKAVDDLQRKNSTAEVLNTAVEVAENILDFDISIIALREGNFLVPKAYSGGLGPEVTDTKFEIGQGLAGNTILNGETIWAKDVRKHPMSEPTNREFRTCISTPIGKLGVFQVISKKEDNFDRLDVELIEILAGHLREELQRVSLEEKLRKKAESITKTKDKLESLHEVARKLESAKERERVYKLTVNAAENVLDFLFCNLGILQGEYIVTKATSSGLPPEGTKTMKVTEGLSGKTYRTGKTYVYGDIRKVKDAKPVRSNYRSFISTPIGDLGVFQVVSEKIDAFTEEDVRLVELLIGHVYEALKRIQLEERLKEQAIMDPLTGVYNRRYLNETLTNESERSKRYSHKIAFLMIDINRFKEINDRYSHSTGDKVLQTVADLLQKNVRNADTVFRYGGDEFLIMMPETDHGIKHTVTRLREELKKWNKTSELLDFSLTLAMGFSYWNPYHNGDIEATLKEADREMYQDKKRN